jgi:hypothetical protein
VNNEMRGFVYSILMLAGVASGCSQGGRGYDSYAEIKNEGDLSVAKAVAIPEDASSIVIRSDVEAGLYYISFDTSHAARYIKDGQMLAAGRELSPLIRDSLGFGAKLPPNIALYYRCGAPQDLRINSYEIVMMGSDGKRQHLWNRRNDEGLQAVLCQALDK